MRWLKINGTKFDGTLLTGWSISKKINQTSTFNCRILDISLDNKHVDISNIIEGSNLEFYSDNEKLFSGLIKSRQKEKFAEGIMSLNLTVSDNNEIANRRRIAVSVVNKSVGDIVKKYILHVLSEEGVTEGAIEEGPILSKVNFNYITCSQALNYLQTCSGLNWNIDNDKKLNVFSNSMKDVSFNITDDTHIKNFKATGKYEQYRNIQYILGGQAQTSIQENEVLMPVPDGEIKEFYTRLPISVKPKLEIYIDGSWKMVPDSDIGVNGLESGKKFYFSNNSKTITHDNGEEALPIGTRIRASYIGLKDVLVIQKSDTQIASRSLIEGNSGKYEHFEKNSSLITTDEAKEYAEKLITKYGEVEDKISFSTEESKLEVGQIIHVKKTEYGIDERFLIESVTISPIGVKNIEYSVSAVDGLALGGWETYFQSLVQNQGTIQAEENIIFPKTIVEGLKTSENMACLVKNMVSVTYMSDNTIMQDLTYMGNYKGTEVSISE